MIISLKELNKFIPNIKLDTSVEKAINDLGYEVEEMHPFSDVKSVQFGKIIDVVKNPNSKNLLIVTLETKKGKVVIQTTAQNPQKGYMTIFFPIGAKKGDITFGAKEMAGVVSNGMMAGYNELGYDASKLPYDSDGIILLNPKEFNINDDPMEVFNLDDYIIDVTTPANRGDSNSYYVLAREIAAYYHSPFKWFDLSKTYKTNFKSKIRVNKKEARALSFIETQSLNNHADVMDVLFLAKHGVEAKDNWAINLTNLTLILTGAPAHVYDRNKIQNQISCIDYSGKATILGNKEVEVKNVLAIADNSGIISLASVMGLMNSSVDDKSQNFVFEIGSFDPKKVRHAAKEIKIESASSIQGGKNVNNEMVRNAMKYLEYRIHKDKQLASQIVNLPVSHKGVSVLQNRRKLATYANCELKDLKKFKDVEETLKTIGFKIDKNRLIAPNYRNDIEKYEDIIEEYFRFYGYDNFKPIAPNLLPFKVDKRNISKNLLAAMGYKEIRTFTLVAHDKNDLNPFDFKNTIKLATFVSKEREVIRNSIIPSMLEAIEYNLKRKISNLSFFEYGMINNNEYVYGLVSNVKNFNEIKQDIINFLKLDNLEFIPFKDNQNIHPNVSAKIMYQNKMIGWIGKTHPSFNDLPVYVAEFKNVNENKTIEFESYDANPLKTIDLTFEINKQDYIGKQVKAIKEIANVYEIIQVDEYHHDDKRNVTLRISADSANIEKINNKFNK